jgi:hypothetical protein
MERIKHLKDDHPDAAGFAGFVLFPQPAGHPVSLAECDPKLRQRQAQMGVSG